MTYYFKNSTPSQKVWLSGLNVWGQFQRVNDATGILVTTKESVAAELRKAQAKGISGVTEITQAEWADLESKKNSLPSPKPWREEFAPRRKQSDTGGSVQQPPPKPQPAPVAPEPARPAARAEDRKRPARRKIQTDMLPDEFRPTPEPESE